jgi:hypothetical protein
MVKELLVLSASRVTIGIQAIVPLPGIDPDKPSIVLSYPRPFHLMIAERLGINGENRNAKLSYEDIYTNIIPNGKESEVTTIIDGSQCFAPIVLIGQADHRSEMLSDFRQAIKDDDFYVLIGADLAADEEEPNQSHIFGFSISAITKGRTITENNPDFDQICLDIIKRHKGPVIMGS